MKYFSPEQSKILQSLGLTTTSQSFYMMQRDKSYTIVTTEKTLRELEEVYPHVANALIYRFCLYDFISPSEVARENCKKLLGKEKRCDCSAKLLRTDGSLGWKWRCENKHWMDNETYDELETWNSEQHRLLDFLEDEVIEEIMKQANTLKQ